MADVRINTLFFRHPKTIKLQKKAGPKAVLALIQLWFWVAENRPKGELYGMDAEDIAIAADWDGDNLKLISLLVELRFIDFEDGIYRIHDWKDHNPWLFGSTDRKEHSKKAAKARWDKLLGKTEQDNETCSSMPSAMPNDALSINEHCTEQESAMPNECTSMPSAMPQYQYQFQSQDQSQDHLQNTSKARSRKRVSPGRFDEFWVRYPVKGSKAKAEVAWKKVTDEQAVLDALDAQIKWRIDRQRANVWTAQWRHASTWLNQRGWEDVLDPLPTAPILSLPAKRAQTQAERNRSALAEWMAMGDDEL